MCVACVWLCGVCVWHVECIYGILPGVGSVWYIWMWAQTRLMFALGCACVPLHVNAHPARGCDWQDGGCSSPTQSACLLPSWGQVAPNRFSMPGQAAAGAHHWLDLVKRKQTICSQGAQLGISVSLQQGQTQPWTEKRRGLPLIVYQTLFRAEDNASNCQGSGNNKAFQHKCCMGTCLYPGSLSPWLYSFFCLALARRLIMVLK